MESRRFHEVRSRTVVIAIAALIVAVAPPTGVGAAEPVQVDFEPTDAEQSWVVPDGVSSIHVVLIGASDGSQGPGGFGHVVTGDLEVTPGSTLFVEVGGNGTTSFESAGGAGGFNGGGDGGTGGGGNGGTGGGGASDIRTIERSAAGSLESRLIVAGGGGGHGGSPDYGGPGGSAGTAGSNGDTIDAPGGTGGGAGTSAAGGAAGTGGTGGSTGGAVGLGGRGGNSDEWADGGGGGGGGYYGGGGGGGGNVAGGSGGGGGGSSYTGAAQNASVVADTSGRPRITISYSVDDTPPDPTPGADTGVVDAEVMVPTSAACIELSTTEVSFGTQRFGGQDIAASPGITVTNCSGDDLALLARGTDAEGDAATWQLVDNAGTCGAGTLDTDNFHLKIRRPANEADPIIQLSTGNKQIAELTGGADADLEALLDMPCPGSSGAGQTMGMQIVFVVTEGE